MLGGIEVDYPAHPHDEARPVTVYVRPHELNIDLAATDDAGPKARVLHVNPAGPVARVQVRDEENDAVIHIDVSLARFAELDLRAGDLVHVSPRRIRVFEPDYVI